MNFIIFKIGFSNYYNGLEQDDLNIYDKFYQEKKSNNPEIYNFQDYNNYCYGYASLKSGVVNLSKINFKNDTSTLLTNALILWVEEKNNKYYLVGWYKNATVYNFLQRKLSYPSVGRDLYFNVKSKSSDCYLLPVQNRTFCIDVNFEKDNNFYLGDDKNSIYENVLNFINSYNGGFCNLILKNILDDTLKDAPENPITLYKRGIIYLYNESNFLEALKYFNTALLFKNKLNNNEIVDVYYAKAICLQFLNCFDDSLCYFKKVIDIVKYDLNILKNMIYLCIYTEKFDNAIDYCNIILKTEKPSIEYETFLDEIKCLKADCYLSLQHYKNALNILNEIENNTKSDNLKLYCKNLICEINNCFNKD